MPVGPDDGDVMSRRACFVSVLVVAGSALLPAQTTLVSPAFHADVEGASSSRLPFAPASRHQQIHGDLRGTPSLVRALSFRRDGIAFEDPRYLGRTVELELRMASADRSTAAARFDANYLSPVVTVLPLGTVSLPDRRSRPVTTPAPFDLRLPLAVPYPHVGSQDLLWETRVGRASSAPYPSDLAVESNPVTYATTSRNGRGCQTALGEFQLDVGCNTSSLAGRPLVSYVFTGLEGPRTGIAALAFGVGDPNLTLPGICAPLRVNPSVFLPVTFSAPGTFRAVTSTPLARAPVGQPFDVQALAYDPLDPAGSLRLTGGVTVRVNPPKPAIAVTRIFAEGDAQARQGTVRPGTAVVVRFDV